MGAAALGVLVAAPAAAADGKDKSPKQRVDRVASEGYGAQLTFGPDDEPRAAAVPGLHGKPALRDDARAADGGYTCVSDHKRRGFVIYQPQPLIADKPAYYVRFVYHLYKQNKARKVVTSRGPTTMKQWEVCTVGGAESRGGNRLSRVVSSMTMGGGDRLIGWKWGKGKEISEAKATLKFAVPIRPVTVEGSVDVHPTYTFTGSQGPDKDAPAGWAPFEHNQVNAIWEGSSTFRWQGSTHFEGNVGHALWELPQKMRTQPISYSIDVRRFCGHPGGIGCS